MRLRGCSFVAAVQVGRPHPRPHARLANGDDRWDLRRKVMLTTPQCEEAAHGDGVHGPMLCWT